MCGLSPAVIFIKNRSERKGQTVDRELMSYALIYLFISPGQKSILKKKKGGGGGGGESEDQTTEWIRDVSTDHNSGCTSWHVCTYI